MTTTPLERIDAERQIAENVSTLIHRSGLTVRKLATGVGINQATLSRRQRSELPWQFWEVRVIADFFGVTIEELTGELPKSVVWRSEIVGDGGTASGTRTPNLLIRGNRRQVSPDSRSPRLALVA